MTWMTPLETGATERGLEAGRLNCGNQGLELAGADGGVDDVLGGHRGGLRSGRFGNGSRGRRGRGGFAGACNAHQGESGDGEKHFHGDGSCVSMCGRAARSH